MIYQEPLVSMMPSWFFDGAALDHTGGAGIHLLISQSHHFHIVLGYGKSTNTRAEPMVLWALLHFSKEIGIPMLHMFGDSLVVIKWAQGRSSLATMDLEAWCMNIIELSASFISIYYQHFYREYNKKVDILSKEGLKMASGLLSFTEYCEGIVIGEGNLQIF